MSDDPRVLPHDTPLDFHWKTKPDFIERAGVRLTGNVHAQRARNAMMTCLVLAAAAGGGGWVSYSRTEAFYSPLARYEGTAYTYGRVLSAVDELLALGLVDEERALPGNHLRTQRQSRIRATPALLAAMHDAPFEHVLHSPIELRNADGNRMAFTDTQATRRLSKRIEARNRALAQVEVTAPPQGTDGWDIRPHHLVARSEKTGKHATVRPCTPHVVQVWGRGRFDMHGRLYGWWQGLPKARRAELLINGEIVMEPDFAMLHPTLLYAMNGKAMAGDPYETGYYPRAHGKLALNVAINARSLHSAVRAIMDKDDWKRGYDYTKGLVDAVVRRNAPIADCIGSDAGIRLMAIDGRMALTVLEQCEGLGIPALPIHDSFSVPASQEPVVTAIMAEALEATCNAINPCRYSTIGLTLRHMGHSGVAVPLAEPLGTPFPEGPAPLSTPEVSLSPKGPVSSLAELPVTLSPEEADPLVAEPDPALLQPVGRSPLPEEGLACGALRIAPVVSRPRPFLPESLFDLEEDPVPVPVVSSRRAEVTTPPPRLIPAVPPAALPVVTVTVVMEAPARIVVDLAPHWGIVETDPHEAESPAEPVYGMVRSGADPTLGLPTWLAEVVRRIPTAAERGVHVPRPPQPSAWSLRRRT